jgi:hypothetical protein
MNISKDALPDYLMEENDELVAIFVSSIKTAKKS